MVISHIHIDSYHNNQTHQFNNLSRNTLNGSPCSGLVNVSAIISFVFIYIKETSPEMYLFIPRQYKKPLTLCEHLTQVSICLSGSGYYRLLLG